MAGINNLRMNRALHKIVENGGNVSKAMSEAGYSKAYQHNPQKFLRTAAFKKIQKPIEVLLQAEARAAMRVMKGKRPQASYGTLGYVASDFTKLNELLSGRPTDIHQVVSELDPVKKRKILQRALEELDMIEQAPTVSTGAPTTDDKTLVVPTYTPTDGSPI